MITRLEREEESQNSDEWQFQGGTFAGTMINPIQHPSNGRIMKTNFKFPGTFCGVFKSKARLWGRKIMGFGVWESPFLCYVTLGNFIHLSEPPFLHLSTVSDKSQHAPLYAGDPNWSLYGFGPAHILGALAHHTPLKTKENSVTKHASRVIYLASCLLNLG